MGCLPLICGLKNKIVNKVNLTLWNMPCQMSNLSFFFPTSTYTYTPERFLNKTLLAKDVLWICFSPFFSIFEFSFDK